MLRKIDDAMFDGFFIWPGFQNISDWVESKWNRNYAWLARVSLLLLVVSFAATHVYTKRGESSLLFTFILILVLGGLFHSLGFEKGVKPGFMNAQRLDNFSTFVRLFVLITFFDNFRMICFDSDYAKFAIDGFELIYTIIQIVLNIAAVCYFFFSACTGLPPGKKFEKKVRAKPAEA